MKKSIVIAHCLLGALLAHTLAAVELTFDPTEVIATELTEGFQTVVFSVSRETLPWSVRVVPREEITSDDDADGRIEVHPENGVAVASVWAAVDLETGDFDVAGPEGSSAREVEFNGARGLRHSPNGLLRRLEHDFESLELLVARPGVGAWRHSASEGGPRDHGPPDDGKLEIDLEESVPVGNTDSVFDELRSGDVLVGVDPRALRFFAVRFVTGGGQ